MGSRTSAISRSFGVISTFSVSRGVWSFGSVSLVRRVMPSFFCHKTQQQQQRQTARQQVRRRRSRRIGTATKSCREFRPSVSQMLFKPADQVTFKWTKRCYLKDMGIPVSLLELFPFLPLPLQSLLWDSVLWPHRRGMTWCRCRPPNEVFGCSQLEKLRLGTQRQKTLQ